MFGKNGALLPNIGKGPFGPLLPKAPLRVLWVHTLDAFCQTLAKTTRICRTLATRKCTKTARFSVISHFGGAEGSPLRELRRKGPDGKMPE
jgi:hypothetical protein